MSFCFHRRRFRQFFPCLAHNSLCNTHRLCFVVFLFITTLHWHPFHCAAFHFNAQRWAMADFRLCSSWKKTCILFLIIYFIIVMIGPRNAGKEWARENECIVTNRLFRISSEQHQHSHSLPKIVIRMFSHTQTDLRWILANEFNPNRNVFRQNFDSFDSTDYLFTHRMMCKLIS